MGMRAVGIFMAILALTASAAMMEQSGFNDHIGMNPDTGVREDHVDDVSLKDDDVSTNPDVTDYLGFAADAIGYFLNIVILLNPTRAGLVNVGFPEWFIFPIMNLVVRPLYYLSAVQIIRGVVLE
ncbi:hypothetical protein [Natrinema sp. DC36]|uniref:hypothetical protein n=1 Tax=Natrinema sp. DC36 TaxID=2878680 RepID=UPI001CEFE468|nr:hypothetical protein [Natrinema sp. DC36]